MKDAPKPDKRRKYDAAFRAGALRLAAQSCSTQAAARALNIDAQRIYQWQLGGRGRARRPAQELEILKKAIASKRFRRVISQIETP